MMSQRPLVSPVISPLVGTCHIIGRAIDDQLDPLLRIEPIEMPPETGHITEVSATAN
jgi:hypothetical protein